MLVLEIPLSTTKKAILSHAYLNMFSLVLQSINIALLLFNRNTNFAASGVVSGKKTVESLSISSLEEADIMERGEDSYDVSDGDEMEQRITNTFSQPLHHSQDLHPHTEMKPNTSSGVSQVS